MRSSIYEFILNIITGVAWFVALTGAFFAFKHSYGFGFVVALSAGFLGLIPGLLMVIFLESIATQNAMRKEQKKQSETLNEILQILKNPNQ